MLLYLVRHGIAIERDDPKCPVEFERFLTREGKARTREAARGMRALGVQPAVMMSSPLVRAMQTAEIFARELGLKAEEIRATGALEPGAAPEGLFAELAGMEAESVICFGHAPNLDFVIARALGARGAATALKKSGAACLETVATNPPSGTLQWLMTPKMLRALGNRGR